MNLKTLKYCHKCKIFVVNQYFVNMALVFLPGKCGLIWWSTSRDTVSTLEGYLIDS